MQVARTTLIMKIIIPTPAENAARTALEPSALEPHFQVRLP
jgi:hypothetical protein